jgi:hypothetical protein
MLCLAKAGANFRPPIKDLEADYKQWLCAILPAHFPSRPSEQFAPHHDLFWQWAWKKTPAPPAAMLIWNRGGAKSTSAEAFAVAGGARGWHKYVLYVCRTQEQADKHIRSINSMLLESNIGDYYPKMKELDFKTVSGRNKAESWTRQQLTTAHGFTAQGIGLLGSVRGIRIEQYRPDLIIISDIDNLNDSVGMSQTLLEAMTADVFGTIANNATVLFEQNLIHRGSVANQVYTRKTDAMSDRVVFGPVPAVRSPKYKRENEKWHITAGEPTWPAGMPIPECERKLNLWTKAVWDREAQHDINLAYPDAIYGQWDEVFHVITWSEFAHYFEAHGLNCHDNKGWRLPAKGKIVMAQDWGNNHQHPCANRWAWRPPEGMPREVARDVFFYREMCWPRFPKTEDDDREHPSAMVVGQAIHEAEKPWGENGRLQDGSKRVQWRIASHERPEIVRGYQTDLPMTGYPALQFAQINTARARQGITHMQDFLDVDETKQNPFRYYPKGHPEAGQQLRGKARVWFVVADGQGELYWDAEQQKLAVAPAVDEEGQARTRFEYPNYRKPDTADGAERKDPPKIDDDIIDCDRAIAGDLFPKIEPLSLDEQIIEAMPKKSRERIGKPLTDEGEQIAQYTAFAEAKAKVTERAKDQQVKGYVPMRSRLRQRWRQN